MKFLLSIVVISAMSSGVMAQTVEPAAASPGFLSTLEMLAISFLAVVLPTLATYIAWILKQKMDIQQKSADAAVVDKAVGRAGGAAYALLAQEAGAGPHSPGIRDAAVAKGVNNAVAAVPDALARLGVDNAAVTNMVSGELGKLEAADPNVSIVKSAGSIPGMTPVSLPPGTALAAVPATPGSVSAAGATQGNAVSSPGTIA